MPVMRSEEHAVPASGVLAQLLLCADSTKQSSCFANHLSGIGAHNHLKWSKYVHVIAIPVAVVGCLMLDVWFPAHAAQQSDVAISSADAIAMYNAAIQVIRSYDVTIHVTTTLGEGAPDKLRKATLKYPQSRTYRQMRSADRFRLELHKQDQKGKLERIGISNADCSKMLHYGTMRAIVDRPTEFDTDDGMFYDQLFATTELGVTITSVLASRQKVTVNRLSGLAGTQLLIDSPPEKDSVLNVIGLRLYLELSRGLMPSRIVRYRLVDNKLFEYHDTLITQFKRLPTGICVPTGATVRQFGTDSPVNPLFESRHTVDEPISEWNRPVPESFFRLTFPAGVTVTDRVRKLTYVVGQENINENLDDLAEKGRELLSTPADSSPAVGRLTMIWWLTPVAISILVIAFLISQRLRK